MSSLDEQREMRRTVAEFLDRQADPARLRTLPPPADGFDGELWRRAVVELGVGALVVPESAGGLGLTFADGALVLTEFSRRLVPGPLLDTMVATAFLSQVDTPSGAALLRRTALEGLSFAIATEEVAGAVGTGRVTETGAWQLSGRKRSVVHGAEVDVLLVTARVDGVPAVFAVDGAAPGVSRIPRAGLDHTRRYAEVVLDGAPADLVDGPGPGRLLDLMWVALAVDSVAAARQCLEQTVAYLKVRQQFGRPIGSFQAIKHRCADMAVTLAGAEATAQYAVQAAQGGGEELSVVAPLAKSVCADAFMVVAAEAVQLHGGIGFTFEHEAHLYLKHAKANQQLHGSGAQLRREVGRLAGI
ncbi:acyl-CoA dehydrogenase [Nakamurella silvestris]|nr:acyl-CoA dehydrogenase [Nakamurella silvestris]